MIIVLIGVSVESSSRGSHNSGCSFPWTTQPGMSDALTYLLDEHEFEDGMDAWIDDRTYSVCRHDEGKND